jgi:hypothetical protein
VIDDNEDDGARTPLWGLINFLATTPVAQRVARTSIAAGYKHNRRSDLGVPNYDRQGVTSINQLAMAIGFRKNSSLYPQNGKLTAVAENDIRQLYKIPETSACWQKWDERDVEGFALEFRQLHASTPIPWSAPGPVEQFLARAWALEQEVKAGADIGGGEFVVAGHSVSFNQVGPCGKLPSAGSARAEGGPQLKPVPGETKPLSSSQRRFADVEFPRPLRNDFSPPHPLSLDVCLGAHDDGPYATLCEIRFILSGNASVGPVGDRRALPGSLIAKQAQIPVPKSRLTVTPGGGGKSPNVIISVKKGPIGAFTLEDLIEVHDATNGDTVYAYLVVSLKGVANKKG